MLPVLRKRFYVPVFNNDYFGSDFISSFFSDGADYIVPAVNIRENDNNFEIEVAAPGLNKQDIKITLEKDVLTISSKKDSKRDSDGKNYSRREFNFHSFFRSFSIPESIDLESIKASMKDGILTVELPKVAAAKLNSSKVIEISW